MIVSPDAATVVALILLVLLVLVSARLEVVRRRRREGQRRLAEATGHPSALRRAPLREAPEIERIP